MATSFGRKRIAEWIGTRIRQLDIDDELSLKTVQFGSLEEFPAVKTLSDHVPAVFVRIERMSPTRLETANGKTYFDEYQGRAVLVTAIPDSATSDPEAKRDDVERIADVVRENFDGTGLSLGSTQQQVFAFVTGIEYYPPEDGAVKASGARLMAGAVTFTVRVQSTLL